MVRGDGTLGSYSYARRDGGGAAIHLFRLALADVEALNRTQEYLRRLKIDTRLRRFSAATATTRQMDAIQTGQRAAVEGIGS